MSHHIPARCIGILLSMALLTGCADIGSASPQQIQAATRMDTGANRILWSAPELEHSKFRLVFYGYDKVYYHLQAEKSPIDSNDGIHYRLLIDANYGLMQGLRVRHYDQVRFADNTILATQNRHMETMRCQIFSDMTQGCLYRDRAEVELDPAQLAAAGNKDGLSLTLGSDDQNYENIVLPASYIAGFLQAVSN